MEAREHRPARVPSLPAPFSAGFFTIALGHDALQVVTNAGSHFVSFSELGISAWTVLGSGRKNGMRLNAASYFDIAFVVKIAARAIQSGLIIPVQLQI